MAQHRAADPLLGNPGAAEAEVSSQRSESAQEGAKYWAFISYSHKDEAWARWLHRQLETYTIPRRLIGHGQPGGLAPDRFFPIFRDQEELSGSSSLSAAIQEALAQSRFLIVICSPSAARSHWVNEEARLFKAMGRGNRVLCLIVAGEPSAQDRGGGAAEECFPPAVRFRVEADGSLGSEPAEPLAVDVRHGRGSKRDAKLKLAAGLLEVGFDELKQRDRQRRLRHHLRMSALAAVAIGALGLAYLGLVDIAPNLPLPGHKSIAEFLDLHRLSQFRTIHTEDQIRRSASEMRRRLLPRLIGKLSPEGQILRGFRNGAPLSDEVWTTSQSLCGLAKAPEVTAQDLRRMRRPFDAVFAPKEMVLKGGREIGWRAHPWFDYAESEPALWTAASLAAFLRRRNELEAGDAEEYWQRLDRTQQILKNYQPRRQTGGWNLFPLQLGDEHSDNYSSALALLALLETRDAGLPWEGSARRRDELIVGTARWLVDHFAESNDLAGWTGEPDSDEPPTDGLTLQIYAELLRAEAVPGFTIPEHMLRHIPGHLSRLFERDLEYPNQSQEIAGSFLQDGHLRTESESIQFLWYPWGLQACWLWLERSHHLGSSDLNTIRVRRALGHLVVDLGDEAVKKLEKQDAFRIAEMLYGLGSISAP